MGQAGDVESGRQWVQSVMKNSRNDGCKIHKVFVEEGPSVE
jgi:hypothetical protein